MRVLLSVPYPSPWRGELPVLPGVEVEVLVRDLDWNLTRVRRVAHTVRNATRLFRTSHQFDAVVVCTTAADAIAAGLVLRLRPRVSLTVWDLLLPSKPLVRRVGRLALSRVDRWLVIRRGDAETFERELGARDCRFVAFPATPWTADAAEENDIVYAAGSAHRDWPTLVEAAGFFEGQVLIATNDVVDVPAALSSSVVVIPALTPADGREQTRKAAVVCLPLLETILPSGPVVLLDAMSCAKAIVASDVNGARDYIDDGVSGRLVPPDDPAALAAAISELLASPELRRTLGIEARTRCEVEFAVESVFAALIAELPRGRGEAR